MILIQNGLVKTMAGEDIQNGCVLIGDDGKIAAVGAKLEAPAGCEVLDACGCIVAPGLVEGHCHVGIMEESVGFEGNDTNETSDPITPQMRGIDGFMPFDTGVSEALAAGVTTAAVGPGSANVIGGTFSAVKLHGVCVDDMVLKSDVAMKCAFGENPKGAFGKSGKAPVTRMATAALMRETLFKARRYLEECDEAEHEGKRPPFDMKLEAMKPVMRGEIPLKAHAHRADDILTAVRIAREFGLKLTLDHCSEGHLIAEKLAEVKAPAFIGPTMMRKSKHESRNKTFETPKILNEAGIELAIITDAPVIPLYCLPMCAGMAVQAGLPLDVAWRSITITPARLLGVGDRIGSLEVGKDADIAVFEGDPVTEVGVQTRFVLVDGKIVHRK